MLKSLSDSQIISQVLGGDADAFETLVQRYQDYVFAVISKHVPYEDVGEVAQQTFVQAYESLTTLRQAEFFKTWLTTIAIRRSHDFWRRRRSRRETPASALSASEQHVQESHMSRQAVDAFQSELEQRTTINYQVIDRALGRLSAGDRMVLVLLYFEDKSVRDISALLGMSTANVKVRAFRARLRMRKLLKEFEVDL